MPLSSSEELGKAIANNSNRISALENDAFPNDTLNSLLIAPIDSVKATIVVTGTAKYYPETSFILDHFVYGEIDSSTLQLDGGYLQNIVGASFADGGLSFDIDFDEVSNVSDQVLFTYTS